MRHCRGKTKKGEWVYGYFLRTEEGCRIIDDDCCDEDIGCAFDIDKPSIGAGVHEVIPETVGEFADLHDKKAKRDLYSGDRVVIGKDRGVLVWDEFDLCWSLQIADGEYQSICRFYSSEEIDNTEYLGNIHEEEPCQS